MNVYHRILTILIAFFFINYTTTAPEGCKNKEANADHTLARTKKIVLIAGSASHGSGEHEFTGGCHILADRLNKDVPGMKAIVVEDGWPKDTTVFDGADAIVMYCDGGDRHMVLSHMADVERLAKKGVGIVMLHYAVEVPKGMAGAYVQNWIGGYFETYWSVNPWWKPSFTSLPKHPVTSGVKPFELADEWYYHMRFVPDMKYITPILTLVPPLSTIEGQPDGTHSNNSYVREALSKAEVQTMAWAYDRPGGGRGFGFTGGHMHKNWANDEFRKLVLNAIVWTANGTIPAGGIESATPSQQELDEYLKKLPQ